MPDPTSATCDLCGQAQPVNAYGLCAGCTPRAYEEKPCPSETY